MNRHSRTLWGLRLMGLLIVPLLLGASSAAQEKPALGSTNPIVVTADTLEADNKAKMATFAGNVVAKQAQEKETLFIYCQKLIVHYLDEPEKKGGVARVPDKKGPAQQNNKIDKIIAAGQVKIVQGEDVATGENATFYNADQKIILSGNPKVWQGKNLVKGEEITVWIKENRSLVTSKGSNRVQAVIHQDEKK